MPDIKRETKRFIIVFWALTMLVYGALALGGSHLAPSVTARLVISLTTSFTSYLSISLFFGLYVASIGIYQQHLAGTLPAWGYILGGPIVAALLIIDVFFQYTFVALVYREWPPRKEYTVSERLARWKHTAEDTREKRWSIKVCKLLNLFTPPSAPHC
jgi:hypothetical protein